MTSICFNKLFQIREQQLHNAKRLFTIKPTSNSTQNSQKTQKAHRNTKKLVFQKNG